MKRVVLSAAIMMIIALSGYAQQDPLISQYMFNHQLVNPAYSGSKDYAMASALFRTQWTKLEGQPVTFLASINGPVFKSRKVGLGLFVANDNIGITNRTTIMGSYAYHIPLNNNGLKLGLGVNAGVFYQHNDLSKAILTSSDPDHVYTPASSSKITPEVGVGAYLYNEKFYVGLSVPEILSYDSSRPASINGSIYQYVRHYWATGGVALVVNEDFVIRPSIMLRYSAHTPLQADLNCSVLIKKFLWLGVTLRGSGADSGIPESVVGMVEFLITKQLRLGYSYDFTTTDLSTYGGMTHEITLGYDFGYDILKMKSPRYF